MFMLRILLEALDVLKEVGCFLLFVASLATLLRIAPGRPEGRHP